MIPHAFWMEWVWLAAASVAWFYSMQSMFKAWGDRRYVVNMERKAQAESLRLNKPVLHVMTPNQRFFTRIVFSSSQLYVAKQTVSLAGAIASLFLPPPPPPIHYVPQTILGVTTITLLSILMMVHQINGARWRDQLGTGHFRESLTAPPSAASRAQVVARDAQQLACKAQEAATVAQDEATSALSEQEGKKRAHTSPQ